MFSVWDKTWDKIHKEREWGRYPPEELVRFIGNCGYFTLTKEKRKNIKVLDIGCGVGAGAIFLAKENFFTFAVDASYFAIKRLKERKEDTKLYYLVADIIALPFLSGSFDLIVDIAAITTNRLIFAKEMVKECHRLLVTGGKIFSMLVKAGSWGDKEGEEIEKNTYTSIKEGPFSNLGTVHFYSYEEVISLFSGLFSINIEYSLRTLQNMRKNVSFWVVTGTKL